jgi:RNA polymerase-binding transcription factor DksA
VRVHPQLACQATASTSFPRHVLDRVAAALESAATAREDQLSALPSATTPIAVAHRDSVQRILNAIRAAQTQLAAGTYGDCHRCGRRVDPETGLTPPWAPRCATCAPGQAQHSYSTTAR